MEKVRVEASKDYKVIIAPKLLDQTGEYARKVCGGELAVIVTDSTLDKLYSDRVVKSLRINGYQAITFVVESGEKSKNALNYISLLNFMASNGLTRTDVIIALGGGVVGDLAGFAAATYMRGMKLIQLPTTLLAAVDSSVGGKTAIDLETGKNLVGAFYQPDLVLCDYETLETLPIEVFADGCAEVIKYGIISGRELFDVLKFPIKPQLEKIIAKCVSIKSSIVSKDERDSGVRQLLNLGHTIGHAVEALSEYRISHGSAVATGLVTISRASYKKGICSEDCFKEIRSMIEHYGLPISTDFTSSEICRAALSDKKRRGNTLNLIVPEEIGVCKIMEIEVKELQDFIELGLKD